MPRKYKPTTLSMFDSWVPSITVSPKRKSRVSAKIIVALQEMVNLLHNEDAMETVLNLVVDSGDNKAIAATMAVVLYLQ